jgi:hypothetical protein
VAHCSFTWWFVLQVRAVLALRTRTLRMIQIHGTMHTDVTTVSLQVSYGGSSYSLYNILTGSSGICEKLLPLHFFSHKCSVLLHILQAMPWPMQLVTSLGLHPSQFMWDLWWTKLHYDRFVLKFFGFPLSVSCHSGCLCLIHNLVMNEMPVSDRNS